MKELLIEDIEILETSIDINPDLDYGVKAIVKSIKVIDILYLSKRNHDYRVL